MTAPHADRDHSEQPCCGDNNHQRCNGCPESPPTFDPASNVPPERPAHDATPSIVGMVDSAGRPATVYTPPEDLRRDPRRWPTPAEFVAEWERYSYPQRLQLAERILADGQRVAEATRIAAEVGALRAEVERWQDWSNDLAERMPPEFDNDMAQESLIETWVDDLRDRLAKAEAEVERLDSRIRYWRDSFGRSMTARADAAESALAEERANVAGLREVGLTMLATFVYPTHPGRPCKQSGHIPVETLARWNAALAGPAQPADQEDP